MNKRQLHHFWTRLRIVKPWYFLILTVIFSLSFVFALRANYVQMTHLRDAVYQADKDNKDVGGALQKLRIYVYGHMNTNLSSGNTSIYPPIQLKYTYDRLNAADAAKADATNQQVYPAAQVLCERLNPTDFSGKNRVPCITDYVNTHTVKAQTVSDSLYKFDFISPRWSPDLAGWSLLFAVLSFLFFPILWITERVVRKRAG